MKKRSKAASPNHWTTNDVKGKKSFILSHLLPRVMLRSVQDTKEAQGKRSATA